MLVQPLNLGWTAGFSPHPFDRLRAGSSPLPKDRGVVGGEKRRALAGVGQGSFFGPWVVG